MNYLAIDLGAESGRVILGRVQGESITLEEVHRFANVPIRSENSIHWNIPQIWSDLRAGLAKTAALNVRLESISVDSWGVDYIFFDHRGEILPPTFHYRDPRSSAGVTKMEIVPWPTIFELTGIQYMRINTLYQLAAEEPGRLLDAHRLLGVADAFNHLLGGEPRIEISMASTFQLFDPRKKDWSPYLLEMIGLPSAALGKVVPSGTILGELKPELASADILKGTKIVATCSHDTGAAVAAVPASGSNWAYLSSGTWSLLGVELSEPIINDQSRKLNFTNEIGHGGSIRLLKNLSGLWLLQECRRAWAAEGQKYSYAELARLAEAEAPSPSIIFPMDPRFLAPKDMRQEIADYCRDHWLPIPTSPGAFARCIFESLAVLYAQTLAQIEELTRQKIERLHIVGGGSINSFLNQLTANACKIPVITGPSEATALGNIIIQGIASGEIQDLAEARRRIALNFPPTVFQPQ